MTPPIEPNDRPDEAEQVDPLERTAEASAANLDDLEATVNLTGDDELLRQLAAQTLPKEKDDVSRAHLKGLLEALVFASDRPIKATDLAKAASAQAKLGTAAS